jgi:hypothetical protein
MKDERRDAPISFRITPTLKAAIEAEATKDRRSVSALVQMILEDWLAGRPGAPKPKR